MALRRGRGNPEVCLERGWAELAIQQRPFITAYNKANYPDPLEGEWTAIRAGSSVTYLDHDKQVLIAGAISEGSLPYSYLFNDVVMYDHEGCQIYLYPQRAFAPTCYHSATYVGDRVFVIGGRKNRHVLGERLTSVYCLNLSTMSFDACGTSGENPGRIFDHRQSLDRSSMAISIEGGRVETSKSVRLNVDKFEYRIESESWHALSHNAYQVWELFSVDREDLELWVMNSYYKSWVQAPEVFERFRGGDGIVIPLDQGSTKQMNLFSMDALMSPAEATQVCDPIGLQYPIIAKYFIDDVEVTLEDREAILSVGIQGKVSLRAASEHVGRIKAALERLISARCECERIWSQ